MKYLDKLELKDSSELKTLSVPRERIRIPGVYLLFKGDEVVYVGKSSNMWGRLGTHAIDYPEEFDSFVMIESEEFDLLEIAYIMKFRPKMNKQYCGQ